MLHFVHLYGIQVTDFIIGYQINHSPYENEIGDLGNIGIVAFCPSLPFEEVGTRCCGLQTGIEGALSGQPKVEKGSSYSSSSVLGFEGQAGLWAAPESVNFHDMSPLWVSPPE